MKSRETPLSSSTTLNGPGVVGGATPRTSARNVAALSRSLAATIVWFSWTGIGAPPGSGRPAHGQLRRWGQGLRDDAVPLGQLGQLRQRGVVGVGLHFHGDRDILQPDRHLAGYAEGAAGVDGRRRGELGAADVDAH